MDKDQNIITSLALSNRGDAVFAPASITSPGYEGYALTDSGEESGNLRDYWNAIRKHLWLIIALCLLGTAMAAIYVARKPDIYAAESRVQVDLESNPAVGSGKNGSVIINSQGTDPAYFNTQLQILSGAGLLRRVVKTLDLEHNSEFLRPSTERAGSTVENLKRMLGLSGKSTVSPNEEDAGYNVPLTEHVAPAIARNDLVEAKRLAPFVSALQAGLKVDPVREMRTGSYVKDTRLIDISFTHTDPQVAAKVVNAVADTFVLQNLEKKTETNNNAGDFLQKRVAELQAQIRNSEERLVNYAKSHQILSLDSSQNTVIDRLVQLNKQLLEAENERKDAEAAYRTALAPGAANALAERDLKSMAETDSKLIELRARRQQLLVENTEEWPEVKEINQQIASLEKQAKETRGRATEVIVTNLETRYRQAVEREKALRGAFDQQRGETVEQNQAAINYRIIQQEIETNKQLLDGLLQRSKENDVILAGTPNNIYVVDYAIVTANPVGPRRARTVLLAALLSLVAGIGLAVVIEYLNDSIRSARDGSHTDDIGAAKETIPPRFRPFK
jgi:succinoglycan biosynthesis transport protein ExoP